MQVAYLLTLLASLGAMVLLDARFRLSFWQNPVRASVVLGAGVAYFLLWDLFGIGLGIFYRGETDLMTGLQLAPELPVEELVFLTFLCYLTLNAVQGARLLLGRRGARPARPGVDDGTHG
ncbi:lycopene cyclase domain-containing protein [Cryobacterium sp. TMT1-21]|uniref:Lycopene cyclase domain-containing protein n=1 Tax=Cryobacterium shii TaxID=1259235 RepID=A0AAQ2HGZ6_9MICO|nr:MULTISPECIES: lycopene cyclase domain-containing protein [Cryobacterium]TFC52078.1 lycopene cyclase domain-containing protein [Cryobacterium shii]TFC85499.1 lycopene cyclase domain-containing protein [Cryobacterium sp. TmT2-59]TFD06980.1 lycopene cyclase domain-containing protein [Cryobacterium sp. TMT1-21]TFD16224.1 lycopene cyclase domain-containing protein [Cryobacterium sp. TMT2-23]TFD19973.1 lycopene cyclase domain-containing protein [Cryobacterium sp. TMT4-10]